ncbi:outer membrane-stress sensor serine endopeptidase DegS [Tatumella saanichensis]|uniref:outer membrane-stress sensor serine endopeptidase DegS n=1 Tax=Tatumella saanichensis TaxID=480813 RepID=UPI0004A3FAD4|nr:outer membrane-stress sensor serine endopeptidase DegS [Tatumella saanichensis]
MLIKLLRSVIIGLIVAVVLLLAVPGFHAGNLLTQFFSRDTDNAEAPIVSFSQGVRRAAPAVVNVYNRNTQANNTQGMTTLGSGVIMNARGYILTNKHVINNAGQIIVALQDGRFYEATLVGSDAMTDLAVLKISASNLPVIPINRKRIAHIGDLVMAIGNPYNLGQTVTQGIISATGRVGLSSSGRQNFLQTDASINQGNSGGALINSQGELVGINTLTFDKSNDGETPEGIGFAIPTALATNIMDKLIRYGRVIRGFIGITAREIPALHNQGNSLDKIQGLVVSQVAPNGPAEQAGIQPNDLLLSVNGKPAVSAQETMDQVAEIHPGSVIQVQVLRNEKTLTLPVTIEEFPESNQ